MPAKHAGRPTGPFDGCKPTDNSDSLKSADISGQVGFRQLLVWRCANSLDQGAPETRE